MKAIDLIEIIYSDLQTNPKKEELLPYASLIKYVAEQSPNSEVDPSATADGLKDAMHKHAKENKKGNMFSFSPDQSINFCKKYLNIEEKDTPTLHLNAKRQILNLEDFF